MLKFLARILSTFLMGNLMMLLSRKLCTFLLRYLKTTSLTQPITINFFFQHHHHLRSHLATWKYTKAHKGLYIFNKPDVIIMFILKSFLAQMFPVILHLQLQVLLPPFYIQSLISHCLPLKWFQHNSQWEHHPQLWA